MPAGDSRFFTKSHIESHRFNASAELAEAAVHCLELVAELARVSLSFQFKGGNSLLLILDTPKRFSIDVDIATDQPREEIEQCIENAIIEFGVFSRWEKRQHKTKPWLPLASYHIFYRSCLNDCSETSIMLDAQLRRSPYETQFKKVVCGDVYCSETETELPLPSSIIGDKLLTLGPRTLGIPLGKGKDAQRLKHVFDVSRLLRLRPKLALVRESFLACLQHENDLQERCRSTEEIIADTLDLCRSVMPYSSLPQQIDTTAKTMLSENVSGLAPFASHLFEAGYDWQDLRRDMARVALCIAAIGRKDVPDGTFWRALDLADSIYAQNSASDQDSQSNQLWSLVDSWTIAVPENSSK